MGEPYGTFAPGLLLSPNRETPAANRVPQCASIGYYVQEISIEGHVGAPDVVQQFSTPPATGFILYK